MGSVNGRARLDEALRIRHDATAELEPDGRLMLARGAKRFALGPVLPQLAAGLQQLMEGASSSAALLGGLPPEDHVASAQLASVLERLDDRGWLERTLSFEGAPLITVRPLVGRLAPRSPSRGTGAVVLSRFALLRRIGAEMLLESPRSSVHVAVHDARVGAFLAQLARPQDPAGLDSSVTGLPTDVLRAVADVLLEASLVVEDPSDEEADMSLAQWSLPDLLFHASSRQGRHANGYGATWPLRGRFSPLPAVSPPAEEAVAFSRPDLAAVAAVDPPFTSVVEGRQSVRVQDHGSPITVEQLGEFLYRSAGVRHDVTRFSDGSPRPVGMARPYPTGGALYELELYPVVNRCEGLAPGLYRYDPLRHQLELVTAGLSAGLESMLQQTCAKTGMAERPQILLVLTARFGKVMYKYEAIPYATILKNVGVLYQTMYLVATAMGLAPCAVGGGDSDAFASLAGLDYYEETSVGEFLVGSRGKDR